MFMCLRVSISIRVMDGFGFEFSGFSASIIRNYPELFPSQNISYA